MKLNTKRTVLVGFAFLSICAFWQLYDALIPLILNTTFKLSESISGFIMAADNVLALFLLPFFGGLSDRCKSPLGRRRPFILVGTLLAVAMMVILPLLDNSYYSAPKGYKLIMFVVALGVLLFAMGIYRSPAVALMPDVTPKPLRSKGNAIINLMGAVGGVVYLIVAGLLYSSSRIAGMEHVDYFAAFAIIAGVMLLALFILMFFVNEPKLVREQEEYEKAHPEEILTVAQGETEKQVMPPDVKRSLGFLLASIALWFIGYNGVTTWFSTYAKRVWSMEAGDSALCLTVATVGAIISYIPVGNIASKVGRRRTIKFGVVLLASCFAAGFVFTLFSSSFHWILFVIFALVGVAWASINVNSLPMVVEMCSGADVGKFTGLYYTFSMSAQIMTPIVAGFLLEHIGYKVLFIYAAAFVALAFVTMSFVRHGDNKIEAKKGLEAFDVED